MTISERFIGTVITFNEVHGHGRIRIDDGREVRVRYAGIRGDGYRTLEEGDRVALNIFETNQGLQADDVVTIAG